MPDMPFNIMSSIQFVFVYIGYEQLFPKTIKTKEPTDSNLHLFISRLECGAGPAAMNGKP